jgi:hypothetical protein
MTPNNFGEYPHQQAGTTIQPNIRLDGDLGLCVVPVIMDV